MEKETQSFTPGPWRLKLDPYDDGVPHAWIYGGEGFYGEVEDPKGFAISGIMRPGDAHLIVNAPEMLVALINLANEVLGSLPLMEPLARREFGNSNYAILIQRAGEARAIINKARGLPHTTERKHDE